jgi:DNA adenine methylase Dam
MTDTTTPKFTPSLFSYTGSKYRLLSQLIPLFPEDINTLYDCFTGSMTLPFNVECDKVVAIDADDVVAEYWKWFVESTPDEIFDFFSKTLDKVGHPSRKSFKRLKKLYNETHDPRLLANLVKMSFSGKIIRNSKGEWSSSWNQRTSINLDGVQRRIQDCKHALEGKQVVVRSGSYADYVKVDKLKKGDFVYCDPPYLITGADYNKFWIEDDEQALYDFLDKVDAAGVKFGLSNAVRKGDVENTILKKWMRKYKVHRLDIDYVTAHNASGNHVELDEVYVTNIRK